jgi:hypothetical protein
MIEERLHRRFRGQRPLGVKARRQQVLAAVGRPPGLLLADLAGHVLDIAVLAEDAEVIGAARDALPEHLGAPGGGRCPLAQDSMRKMS